MIRSLRQRFQKTTWKSAFERQGAGLACAHRRQRAGARLCHDLDPASAPHPDIDKLQTTLRNMCRNWSDRLRDCLVTEFGEATALALLRRYGTAFPAVLLPSGRTGRRAVRDIHNIERGKATLAEGLIVDLMKSEETGLLHLKLMQADRAITLSEVLPLIENAGLKVEYMGGPYEVHPKDSAKTIFIHEFVGRPARDSVAEFRQIKPAFEESFQRKSGPATSKMILSMRWP